MRRFLTVVFFLLFVILFTALLVIGELRFYVLTPAFIKTPLRETQTYRKIVKNSGILSGQIKEQIPGINEAQGQMPESAQKLTQALLESVEEKWLEREAEKGIDALYEYMTTDQEDIDISIDLREFKSRLLKSLNIFIGEEYNKMPEVPIEQFDQQMAQNPGQFPTSRPAGYTLEQTILKTGVNPVDEIMKNIPDKINTNYVDKNNPEAMNGLAGLKQVRPMLNIINAVFWILLVLTIILLLLFAKLTSKTWLEFLMRTGVYVSAFIVPFILSLILWYVSVSILLVQGFAMIDIPSAAKQILEPFAAYAISRVFMHLVILSGSMSAFGLATAIPTGIILRHKAAMPPAAADK